jgi:VWFA-related protein
MYYELSRKCMCAYFALALAALVGEPAGLQEKRPDAVIRATTRVVNVSLVVTDHEGNPVKNISKEDLILLDDGKPQSIGFFSPVDNDQLVPAPPSPGPDIFTNIQSGHAAPPSVTILLFDMLNSKWTSQAYGLHRVRKFLRQVQPQDHVGLYLLNDQMKVLHDFRDDSSSLAAAIQIYYEEHSHSAVGPAALEGQTVDANLDRFLSGKEKPSRYAIYGDCQPYGSCQDKGAIASAITTASLEEIARQLSRVQGRKTLIWVTDHVGDLSLLTDNDLDDYLRAWRKEAGVNLPSALRNKNGGDIERMVRLMNDAGIAVYTVDARGLETEDLDFRNTKGSSVADPVDNLISRIPEPDPGLLELASRTGGRAFFNRNDLETGVRRALDDSRFTYSLAYYPDHGKWKGEWHKIQVKVNRPDVTVLVRSGYFALPDSRPLPPKNRFEFLSEVAASPIDSPQLPLAVRMGASSGPKGAEIEAHVHVNPQPMLTFQDNGHWKGSFEVVFIQLGEKNKVLNVTNSDVDTDLDAGEYAAILQKGWTLPSHLPFIPGATQLCVILRDKLSDKVGSLHIPLARYATTLPSR